MIKGILSSCLLIIAILLIRRVSQGHIKKRIQYGLWLIVALKLLLFPVPWVTSPMAILSADEIEFAASDGMLWESKLQDMGIIRNGEDGKKSLANPNIDEKVAVDEESKILVGQSEKLELVKSENKDMAQSEGLSLKWEKSLKILLFVIWASGALFFAVKFIAQNHMLKKTLIANRRKYRQKDVPLKVYVVDELASPCLYNGKIYAREELLNNPTKRKHILAHEYCHYKHWDSIWSVVRCICLVIYWWNPLVWLAVRTSKTDCELACDEAVLDLLGDEERISYGKTLISLMPVKKDTFYLVASTMEGSKNSMKDRIKFIANKQKVWSTFGVIVVLMSVAGLVCSCTVKPKDDVSPANTEMVGRPSEEATKQEKSTESARVEDEKTKPAETAETETEMVKQTGNDYSVCTDRSATEVENYAREIAKIFDGRNWNALSENIMYPIVINGKTYENKEKFVADDWNSIFSKEYVEKVKGLKAEEMWANWQGICISDGAMWLGQDASGNLKIITINYDTEKRQED